MYASVTFSLGGMKPGPPSTCRGRIVNAAAAAPLVSMKVRRDRPAVPLLFLVGMRFIISSPQLLYRRKTRMNSKRKATTKNRRRQKNGSKKHLTQRSQRSAEQTKSFRTRRFTTNRSGRSFIGVNSCLLVVALHM